MLPLVGKLKSFVDEELPDDVKIPIPKDDFNKLIINQPGNECTAIDLAILFRVSDTEKAYSIIYDTLAPAIRRNPPSVEATEDAFHQFWDDTISAVLTCFLSDYGFSLSISLPLEGRRNQN